MESGSALPSFGSFARRLTFEYCHEDDEDDDEQEENANDDEDVDDNADGDHDVDIEPAAHDEGEESKCSPGED